MSPFAVIGDSWRTFSREEKRNIAIYIAGIMLYKFGLEAFNGSVIALATNRYDYDAEINKTKARTFERVGLLTGLYQAFQCVGSILIAPLIKRFATKNVLSAAILVFSVCSALLLIVDGSTGGQFVPKDWARTHKKTDFSYYGDYNTDGMIPIYCVAGITYGMVELIRRVVPRDIVGGNVQKLRRMDALVHICYEISGTAGSFCTALVLIPRFGNNMSFIITPFFFAAASVVWFFIRDFGFSRVKPEVDEATEISYMKSVIQNMLLFLYSVWTGAKILFSTRKFVWLLPGYALALYGHRYLENGAAPVIAKRYLGNSAWSNIMVGGSNFGELLGALFVFLFTQVIKTPMPWLRIDALMLLVLWYIPFWYPPTGRVRDAWVAAGSFIPVSFGWAAGDVSLAAYIQASLARVESQTKNVSALGAVMAFLYSTYIVLYAITSPLLGRYLDRIYAETGGAKGGGDVHKGLVNVVGVQFTVIAVIIFASSFIPKGSLRFNPDALYGEDLDMDLDPEGLKKGELAGDSIHESGKDDAAKEDTM